MVFEQVCADLEAAGYEVQAYLIPAAGVGAPHLRYRTWFVAHRGDAGLESPWQERIGAIVAGSAADTGRVGLRERACEQEPVEGCIRAADARACSKDGVADKIAKWKRKGIIRMDGDRVVFSAPPKDAGYLAEELMYEVGDIMWFCAGLARQFGWSLENVCWANLNKLSSRQERGVIEGDGDNR
jgi:site-specific DNA-cytosine methylase